ncbi:hypothetical protein DC081_00605 [Ignatzschineria cameli]|uniref:Uncharacterized protein n=1 Tax=Ignatzschineria cameli TaxID=2182793 RepID=A0A2U2AS62_9GAMM|nr:hypothetical protein DC080_02615 [Ignatzschineria cameli]PWD87100.1 hypothetical protein DC077_04645 [Ignatzschineria cameli]PWD92073.1 hypothetical protein DC079_01580 [Ignatzschineria cameli]PWD93342.1 hypothetical protein DC081_00605 [Ignatzschineria cameli]PWD94084.1 hypothetical protein DC078_00605 [Ignatzschineria cameli]
MTKITKHYKVVIWSFYKVSPFSKRKRLADQVLLRIKNYLISKYVLVYVLVESILRAVSMSRIE